MEQKAYKTIFKATSLFGGTQFIQVILNLVRGKLVALLLGSTGMGLNSLFYSSVTMVNNFTSLGLNFSGVREIAGASDEEQLKKIGLFRGWIRATATFGFIVIVVLSPLLAWYTFGQGEEQLHSHNYYIFAFALLGFMVLFNTLATGNGALLQGTRSLKRYALYTLTASISALVVSVPFYYFFGINGVVPALIFSTMVNYIFSKIYTSQIKSNQFTLSFRESFSQGKEMLRLGVTMMLSTTLGSIAHYLLNTFISTHGNISDLGFYQAGMSITSQSIGLVFTAMAVDYYPRLASVSSDNNKVRDMANQQGVVTLLLATPILLMLSLFAPLIIRILLSKEFLPIADFIRIISFGMLFKATSYSIGTISFAKGDKRVFFILEGIYTNLSTLLFCSIGFYLGGLRGIGFGFLFMHFAYLIVILVVTKMLYNFYLMATYRGVLFLSFTLMALLFLSIELIGGVEATIIGAFIWLFSVTYSVIKVDKLIGIRDMVKSLLKR